MRGSSPPMTVRRIFSSVPARPSPSGRLRRRPLSRGFLAPAGLLRATPVHRASIRIRFPGYRSIISFSRSLSTTPLHIPCFSSQPFTLSHQSRSENCFAASRERYLIFLLIIRHLFSFRSIVSFPLLVLLCSYCLHTYA